MPMVSSLSHLNEPGTAASAPLSRLLIASPLRFYAGPVAPVVNHVAPVAPAVAAPVALAAPGVYGGVLGHGAALGLAAPAAIAAAAAPLAVAAPVAYGGVISHGAALGLAGPAGLAYGGALGLGYGLGLGKALIH
ncbi:hypothetical protein NPIL_137971 [Nephila pilipes]|uniref:Uncharacterized protein n=1 Tax=Nephila pilipes TaxID=299642 RepID=A0A8X6QV62_NEPPI|nr:hypothetical protein NPIL_137971 [Nephila pilipes]